MQFYGGVHHFSSFSWIHVTLLCLTVLRSSLLLLQQLLISSRNLEFFTNGYRYLIQVLPAAVVAPMYFSGKIEFGVINQSVSAFNHILGDFSLIVYQFQAISSFSAVIDRLGTSTYLLHVFGCLSSITPSEEIFSQEACYFLVNDMTRLRPKEISLAGRKMNFWLDL